MRGHEPIEENIALSGGDVEAAIAAGVALGDPVQVSPGENGNGLYAIVPRGYVLESLERFLGRPLRIKQQVTLDDTPSYVAYVNEYRQGGASHIFFDKERENFIAVLDYHQASGNDPQPAWGDHVAQYHPKRSKEFTTWMAQNRKGMSQTDLARFLEDNLPDITEPSAADMLEIAINFEAHTEASFRSGIRLASGQIQLQYNEEIRGGTTKEGTLECPEKFYLGIPVHEGGPGYKIEVRLRWRLKEGAVTFWFEIVRPHRVIDDALDEIRTVVADGTSIPMLAGSVDTK